MYCQSLDTWSENIRAMTRPLRFLITNSSEWCTPPTVATVATVAPSGASPTTGNAWNCLDPVARKGVFKEEMVCKATEEGRRLYGWFGAEVEKKWFRMVAFLHPNTKMNPAPAHPPYCGSKAVIWSGNSLLRRPSNIFHQGAMES